MRTFEHIIGATEEPTEEERAWAQDRLDAWYEKRFERLAEYIKRPDFSGYAAQCIANAEMPTVDSMRQQFAFVREYEGHSYAGHLTAALGQLSEIAGHVTPLK